MTRTEIAARLDEAWPGAGAVYLGMRHGERRQIGDGLFLVRAATGDDVTMERPPLSESQIRRQRAHAAEAERTAAMLDVLRAWGKAR